MQQLSAKYLLKTIFCCNGLRADRSLDMSTWFDKFVMAFE